MFSLPSPLEPLVSGLSSVTAPSTWLLLAPVITAISRDSGLRLLASLVTSAWLSHGLKWSLREHRPYW